MNRSLTQCCNRRGLIAGAVLTSLCLLLPRTAHADFDPEDKRGNRVGYEVAGSFVGAAGGTLVGAFGTVGVASAVDSRSTSGWGALAYGVGGGIAGGVMGQGVGVYLAGRWSGGNGSYLPTLGGQMVGALLGFPIAVAAVNTHDSGAQALMFLTSFFVLPTTGAIVGYELSTKRESSTGSTSSGLQMYDPPSPTFMNFAGSF